MTTQVVEFKCPSCGHLLGEEEYSHACKNNKRQVDEKVEQKLQQQAKQLNTEHAKQIQKINEKNELEREQEVIKRVAKVVSEEKIWMELKHKQELDAKEKLIEAAKLESAAQVEEKVRHAIADNEVKHRQKEKEFELQHSRIETDNKKLLDQVEKLQKTLDNIPPELRGTAGEFVLFDELKKEFQRDDIVPKQVGVAMADVIQNIVTDTGERISTPIVYDKKMADTVTKKDIEKSKSYKTIHNTDYSIIVTAKGIKNNRFTEEREGILLVHPIVVIDIAKRLRTFITEASKLAKNKVGIESKQSKIYKYVTSAEYNRIWRTIINIQSNLCEIQRKEEEYHRTTWNKRTNLIENWYKMDEQGHGIMSDITQEDVTKDDGENPSI